MSEEKRAQAIKYLEEVTQELINRERKLEVIDSEISTLSYQLRTTDNDRTILKGDPVLIASSGSLRKSLQLKLRSAEQERMRALEAVQSALQRRQLVLEELEQL